MPNQKYSLRFLQTNLPWTIKYSRDFRANPQTHKDFAHAVLHASKAVGHLAGLADDMDHDREVAADASLGERHGKHIADLVVCALRMANTFPGRVLDLGALTVERVEGKNGVSLPAQAMAPERDVEREPDFEDRHYFMLGSQDRVVLRKWPRGCCETWIVRALDMGEAIEPGSRQRHASEALALERATHVMQAGAKACK
jgi:hypothetical protein